MRTLRMLTVLFPLILAAASAQDLYNPAALREFRLVFSQPDWRELLQRNIPLEMDIPARLSVDGVTLDSVGVRYKGNSSLNIPGEKKPFNITTDAFIDGQDLWGYSTLNLNNCFKDPTFVREMIAYRLAALYLPSARTAYARLYINDEYWGLYLHVQQINRAFLRECFGNDGGNHYKCDPRGDLAWMGPDTARYRANYELKTNTGLNDYSDLVEFIRLLDQLPQQQFAEGMSRVLDVDRALWYLAFCNLLVNLDSYIGSGHNYYLYHNPADDRFSVIPWDLNEVLGTFSMQLSIGDREKLPVFHNVQAPNRPLLSRLLSVPEFRARYTAHYRTMFREVFTRDYWVPLIQLYQNLIRSSVQADTKKLYSMQMFDENVNTNVQQGAGTPGGGLIPGILSFIDNRRSYLMTQPELSRLQAVISRPILAPPLPAAGAPARASAVIEGAAQAFLWHSAGGKAFSRVPMTDTGGKWEAVMPPREAGQRVRYYVEAVTAEGVAAYNPERAENESYSYTVPYPPPAVPVVINEVMAWNTKNITDPQGQSDDWLELHNTADTAFDISGCRLSDKPGDLFKWRIPDGTVIEGKGYLVIWADNDTDDTPGLHAGFQIDKDGEGIYFSDSDERGSGLIDSSGAPEYRKDTSWARLPNGTGTFAHRPPTPGADNDASAGVEADSAPYNTLLEVFPNPATAAAFLRTGLRPGESAVASLTDPLGRVVFKKRIEGAGGLTSIDVHALPRGAYLLRLTDSRRSVARILRLR